MVLENIIGVFWNFTSYDFKHEYFYHGVGLRADSNVGIIFFYYEMIFVLHTEISNGH